MSDLTAIRRALEDEKDQLQLTQQQLLLLENLFNKRNNIGLPVIYAVTPTYQRHVQKAELTRISQTLQLAQNIHWILVEDSETKSDLVRHVIADSNLLTTHLNAKTPSFEKLKAKVNSQVGQRNILSTACRTHGGNIIAV